MKTVENDLQTVAFDERRRVARPLAVQAHQYYVLHIGFPICVRNDICILERQSYDSH